MNPFFNHNEFQQRINRRSFLGRAGLGLGSIALTSLLRPAQSLGVAASPPDANGRWMGVARPTDYPIRAEHIIHLCMAGGPSQFESFDNKPHLKALGGKPFPESFTRGQQLAQLQGATLIARARSPRSGGMARAARRFPIFSRTSPQSPTTSASSAQ